jgi:hypothetical protein
MAVANCKKEKKKLENCKAVKKGGGRINEGCFLRVGLLRGIEAPYLPVIEI